MRCRTGLSPADHRHPHWSLPMTMRPSGLVIDQVHVDSPGSWRRTTGGARPGVERGELRGLARTTVRALLRRDGRGRTAQPPGRGSGKRLLRGRRAGAPPQQGGGGQEASSAIQRRRPGRSADFVVPIRPRGERAGLLARRRPGAAPAPDPALRCHGGVGVVLVACEESLPQRRRRRSGAGRRRGGRGMEATANGERRARQPIDDPGPGEEARPRGEPRESGSVNP